MSIEHTTPTAGNVFADLGFDAEEAVNLKVRADLMMQLERFIAEQGWTQVHAAEVFGVTQPRVSDLVRGKIERFTIDALINMAARAGLHPHVALEGAA